MSLDEARRQMSEISELAPIVTGEACPNPRSGEASTATQETARSGSDRLMEQVVERSNVVAALRRMQQNRGSPGIDGMTVQERSGYLKQHWVEIRAQLLRGTYHPQPVRRVTIPKPGGGERQLGIPTVLDRFIQQAILHVRQPRFDPTFSAHSYGFRPGRSAHGAIREAQRYIQEGRRWVVDVDIEKFFDRVNHDVLMGRRAKRIADERVLGLIRRYLHAGIMANGVVMERYEGTPQGGPLSPLLANLLLDEVDQELERRGHAFVRYADDCNVYLRSRRAGERVLEMLRRQYGKLRLRLNEEKSAVAKPQHRKVLGFSFWYAKGGVVKRRVAPHALKVMKDHVRQITRRNGGRSLTSVSEDLRGYLTGWKEYFRLAETPGVFRGLDEWIRHRLRALQLKQWKRGRTVYRELRARGLSEHAAAQVAANTRRWWRNAGMTIHIALPASVYDRLGVPRLAA